MRERDGVTMVLVEDADELEDELEDDDEAAEDGARRVRGLERAVGALRLPPTTTDEWAGEWDICNGGARASIIRKREVRRCRWWRT